MEFTLSTAGYFYKDKAQIERLVELGFKFKYNSPSFGYSILSDKPTIKINTINELVEFSNKWGEIIISDRDIRIYDDYLE